MKGDELLLLGLLGYVAFKSDVFSKNKPQDKELEFKKQQLDQDTASSKIDTPADSGLTGVVMSSDMKDAYVLGYSYGRVVGHAMVAGKSYSPKETFMTNNGIEPSTLKATYFVLA